MLEHVGSHKEITSLSYGNMKSGDDYDYAYQDNDDEKSVFDIEKLYIHPDRVARQREDPAYSGTYDLGLLRTRTAMGLDTLIQPICLPFDTRSRPAVEPDPFTDVGVEARIAGYGQLVPYQGEKCLTDTRGRMRFHVCQELSSLRLVSE